MVNGRPRKTQEELDQEMEDYWGSRAEESGPLNGNVKGKVEEPPAPAAAVEDEDIDMII